MVDNSSIKMFVAFLDNEDTADEIAIDISNIYYNEFFKLQETFILLKEKAQNEK